VWDGEVSVPGGRRRRASTRAATADDRFRLRVAAVLRARPRGNAASHQSAVALRHLDLWGVDLERVDVAAAVRTPQHQSGLRVHPGRGWECDRLPTGRAVLLDRALVQLAAEATTASALCTLDHAVQEQLCTLEQLVAATALVPEVRRAKVRRVLDLVDPAAESVGETRCRLLLRDLGYRVRSQVELVDPTGRRSRVDFLVQGLVVEEFDGLVKYEGHFGRRALADEKARESGLTDLGLEVVRVTWAELSDPAALRRRIEAALDRARRRATDPA
jgi:hypothetical protein